MVAALATFTARGPWTGMDFRTTAYFPAHAFLHGVNGHDPAAYLPHYPGTNPFPPFAPLTLLRYAPLALLPLPIARGVWFVITVTLALAWWVLRRARVARRVRGARVAWLGPRARPARLVRRARFARRLRAL